MKKLILSAVVVAVLAGFSSFVVTAWGQGQKPQASASHKVGLIDMAHVFKNYKKFEALRADLKAEIEQTDVEAKQKAQQIQSLQEEMKTFTEGSPDFVTRETKLAELTSEFETFRKVQQREFLRKESQIYKTVYLDASKLVEQYAEFYGYTLIIRFSRDGLDSANDPQTVIQRMNRQVVYHESDNDITDAILGQLNKQYDSSVGGTSTPQRSATQPTGSGRRQ